MVPEVSSEQAHSNKTLWHSRVTLELSPGQFKSLKRGKRALVMSNKRLYEIKPSMVLDIFDANGKRLSKSAVRRMLKAGC